jgi:hypothetical protein
MVDEETGDWQGLYEWESAEAVELYRRSFVFGVMNHRANPGSITYSAIPRARLADYLEWRWRDSEVTHNPQLQQTAAKGNIDV